MYVDKRANIEFEAIRVATDIVNWKEKQVILKVEQELAVKGMLEGKDVLSVLPTGFGKSMIFTVFGVAKKNIIKSPVSVLIICPLKSTVADQLDQLKGICSAAKLTNENFGNILKDPAEFIYCSAEQALETRFPDALKDQKFRIAKFGSELLHVGLF